jgi:uncharacterized membrane protein
MTPESAKIMGGLGALLLFIGLLPVNYVGILSLVGLILVLVALYGFAGIYSDRGIFNNFLYGILAGIVGAAVAVGVAFATVLTTLTSLLYALYPGWNGDWMALSGLTPDISNITPGDVMPLLGGLLLVLVIVYAAVIVAAFLIRRSLNALAAKTNINLFSTAALIFLIGAFMTIIAVGAILIWVSLLLVAIAFFRIKSQPEYIPPAPASPSPASTL